MHAYQMLARLDHYQNTYSSSSFRVVLQDAAGVSAVLAPYFPESRGKDKCSLNYRGRDMLWRPVMDLHSLQLGVLKSSFDCMDGGGNEQHFRYHRIVQEMPPPPLGDGCYQPHVRAEYAAQLYAVYLNCVADTDY